MIANALLLAAALGAYVWYLKGGPFAARVLAGRRFARLLLRSATLFGGGGVAGLALLGRLDALVVVPPPFAAIAEAAERLLPGMHSIEALGMVGGGLVAGGLIGAGLSRWRRRVFAFGDVRAVLPRSRGELGWAAVLALQSGVSEELFFRLLLPLLIAGLTGSAWVGFGAATALFGFAHRYQGWAGMLATAAVGALLALIYLASGRLWVAMALHAAINLNGLVLRPLAMGLSSSAATPSGRSR